MQHSYLRYTLDSTLGLIASPNANVVFSHNSTMAVSGTLEELSVWNIKLGTKVCGLKDGEAEISKICRSPKDNIFAVGYSDGYIRIWDIEKKEMTLKLKGHKKEISALSFNAEGNRLVSGSNDSTIVIWDMISETGICRLRGHRDMITSVLFIEEYNQLISCSKDTLLKVWSIDGQYCIDTFIGHRTEIWSMTVFTQSGWKETNDDSFLSKYGILTGSSDQSLRLFNLYKEPRLLHEEEKTDDDRIVNTNQHVLEYRGCINISKSGRTGQLSLDQTGTLLGYYNINKLFLLYKIRSISDSNKKMKRRIRRRKEKGEISDGRIQCSDVLELVSTVNTTHKLMSFDFGRSIDTTDEIEMLFGLNNNCIQLYRFGKSNTALKDDKGDDEGKGIENTGSYEKVLSIAQAGHRSDVRALALSSTDDMLLSVGQKDARMWSIRSLECVRSLDVEAGVCCCILPGDKHAVIGTKDGKLVLTDLNTGDIMQSLQAHKGSIWSVDVRRDGKGMVSGGSDHNLCFWEFDIVLNNETKRRQLQIVPTRTLKMSHDVMCVKYSNTTDQSKLLVAVSLLDNTVKLFYEDSLRFFLSLYGHKLPVLSLSISSDNKLIVTGSADKNIKIWGLDFGDCHKSFFAHADSVMSVGFIYNTHNLFSCGKDGVLKYWDADRFELITQTTAHFGEAWALTTSHLGDFVVTAGHDRSIRVYLRSNEAVFLEEERDRELEETMDRQMDVEGERALGLGDDLTTPTGQLQATGNAKVNEVVLDKEGSEQASSIHSGSMRAADHLIATLERAETQRKKLKEWMEECVYVKSMLTEEELATRTENGMKPVIPAPEKDVFMMGMTSYEYVAITISNMPRIELESTLLVLPFENICQLVVYLSEMLDSNQQTEVCIKAIIYIVKLYEQQLEATAQLQQPLLRLRSLMKEKLFGSRDRIGINQAALMLLKRSLKERKGDFDDLEMQDKKGKM